MIPASLKPYLRLSLAAALATIALKSVAWLVTGLVGRLSNAHDSLVNLAGAGTALLMLSIAGAASRFRCAPGSRS